MMGHTPGPWTTTTRQGSWDWVVYQESNPNIEICQMFHDGTEFNEIGEANARLIAAAPDLLAACKAMIRIKDLWLPETCPPECEGEYQALRMAADKLDAAIQKAEG